MTGRWLERAGQGRDPARDGRPAAGEGALSARPGRAARASYGVIAIVFVIAPALLITGWILAFVPLKMVATLLLAIASVGLTALTLIVTPRVDPPAARALLRISGGSIVVAMVLASIYGIGELYEPLAISIPRMAMLHGVLNAIGFALCGLLGWLLAGDAPSNRNSNPLT